MKGSDSGVCWLCATRPSRCRCQMCRSRSTRNRVRHRESCRRAGRECRCLGPRRRAYACEMNTAHSSWVQRISRAADRVEKTLDCGSLAQAPVTFRLIVQTHNLLGPGTWATSQQEVVAGSTQRRLFVGYPNDGLLKCGARARNAARLRIVQGSSRNSRMRSASGT